MTDFVDAPMLDGVTRFQADNGLRRDGAMKPGGPTERLMDTALWEQTRGSGLPKDSIFGVADSVGKSGANKKPDVQGTKRALAWAGFYPKDAARRPNGEADADYQLGLQSFLRAYNFDPRQPLTPGGAPERTLDRLIRPAIARRTMEKRPGDKFEPVPAVSRPGWVYENGQWRRQTAAERARPKVQLMAARDNAEDVGGDLGLVPEDAAPPAPFEAGVFTIEYGKLKPVETGEKNKQPEDKTPQSKKEWKELPEYPLSSRPDRNTYRTKGAIKVERWSEALGVDGIRYKVRWYPLNKQGKRETTVVDPKNSGKEYGGHTGATGLLRGAFGVEPPNDVIQPPYENPHGWEVEIEMPPQASVHGNTRGTSLRVYMPKGEDEQKKKSN